MRYTDDLRRRVTVSPSFIISQKFGSNVRIVNICVRLTVNAWKKRKKGIYELVYLGKGTPIHTMHL